MLMARRVGSWQLDPVPIGSGSFAIVWKAWHVDTGVMAAVKEITTDRLSPKLLESLQSEIAVLRRTQHRNIVTMLDLIQEPGKMFLVLEFCGGGDLGQYLRRYRNVSESTARYFMHQLCQGLRELYALNVLHRDLKPQNLLLSDTSMTPVLKIADFGFARSLQPQGMAETLCGSPLYMAPEILQSHKYDAKADLWSVGTILHELLTGRPPFTGTNHIQLLHNIQRQEPRLADALPPHLSPPCRQLLLGLLRHRPQDRMGFEEFFDHPFVQGPEAADGSQGQQGQVQQQGRAAQGALQQEQQQQRHGAAWPSAEGQQQRLRDRQLQQPAQQLQQSAQQQGQEQRPASSAEAAAAAAGAVDQPQQHRQQGHAHAPQQHPQPLQHPLQQQQQQQQRQQDADSDCEYVVVSGSNSPAPNPAEQAVAYGWTRSAHTATLAGLSAAMGPSASAHTSAAHHPHHHHGHGQHPHAHHHHAAHHPHHMGRPQHHPQHQHHQHQHHQDPRRLHAQGGVGAPASRRAAPIMASMASAWAAAAAQAVATVARSVQHVSPGGPSRQASQAAAAAAQRGTFVHVPQQSSVMGFSPAPSQPPVSHAVGAAGTQATAAGEGAAGAAGVAAVPASAAQGQQVQQQQAPGGRTYADQPLAVAGHAHSPSSHKASQPAQGAEFIPAPGVSRGTETPPRRPSASPTAAAAAAAAATTAGRTEAAGRMEAGGGAAVDAALLWRCAKLPDRLDGPDLLQRVVLLLAESAAARVAAAEAAEEAAEEQEEAEEEAEGQAAAAAAATQSGGGRPAGDEAAAAQEERAEEAVERRAARRRYAAQAAAGALPGQLLALHLYACQLIEVGLAGVLGPQAHAASGGSGSGSEGQGGACGEGSEPAGAATGALRSPGKVADAATAVESTADAASTGSALGTVPAQASVLEQSPPPPLTPMGSLPRASGLGLGLGFGPDPRLVLPLKRQAASLLSSFKGRAVRLLRGQVAAQQQEALTVTQGRQAQQQRVAKSKQRTASKALKSAERSGDCGQASAPEVLAAAGAQEEQEGDKVKEEEENEKAAAAAMVVPDAAEMVLDAAVRYSRAAAADELLGMYPASVEGYARAADLLLFLLADLPAPAGWRHAPGDRGDGVPGCQNQTRQGAKAAQPQAPLGAGQVGCDGCDGDGLREGAAEGVAAGAAAMAAAPAAAAAAVPLMLPERLRPQLSAERRRHAHTVYAAVKLRQAACMQALNAQLSSV